MSNKNGSKWISRVKRLAIYLRDGMCCAYCGSALEDGIVLSLDHLMPRSEDVNHHPINLITCCSKCNSSRRDRDLYEFISSVVSYINHGVTDDMIYNHIQTCINRDLEPFIRMAREIRLLQPSWKESLKLVQDVL